MSNFCVNCCKNKSGEEIICLKCHEEVCSIFNNKIAELEKQLAEKERCGMSRLTKKCGDWGYTVPGLNSVVKDNAEIIGEMTNKLAEYENTGLEPSEIEKLKHDLAVRDRALDLIQESEQIFTFKQYYLDQAEKELKGK